MRLTVEPFLKSEVAAHVPPCVPGSARGKASPGSAGGRSGAACYEIGLPPWGRLAPKVPEGLMPKKDAGKRHPTRKTGP